MQQIIINIMHKSYNMSYNEAYKYLYENMTIPNQRIVNIIEGIIKENDGIDVIINRNPTISLGSILCMKCIGIEYNYTMSLEVTVLKGLAADQWSYNRVIYYSFVVNCWKAKSNSRFF